MIIIIYYTTRYINCIYLFIKGLLSPTYGTVYVNGNDLFKDIENFRQDLGLCPQHNLLFSYLTTLDHLIFFGMVYFKCLIYKF